MANEAIIIKNLCKYFGNTKAVNDLSLTIPEKAICGLLGTNGAGKTTTFRMLCGYMQPTSGTITIFGQKPGSSKLLHGRVSALPQDAQLPAHSTIYDFLRYLGTLQGLKGEKLRQEVDRVLTLVALTPAAKQTGRAMSHGMARRVAMASALLGKPELILLDEPTGGLDPRNAHAVRQIIAKLKGECTIVVASHNLAEIQELCTHVAIIDHGALTTFGTVEEICRKSNYFMITLGSDNFDCQPLAKTIGGDNKFSWKKEEHQLLVELADTAGDNMAEITRNVLSYLIEHKENIITLQHGESLEKRYLELT